MAAWADRSRGLSRWAKAMASASENADRSGSTRVLRARV
jgi:hypothetical protein